jgi:AraC-like DNA-binding protein
MNATASNISEEVIDYNKDILKNIVFENRMLSEDDIKISWREFNLKGKQKYKVHVHDINDYLEMHFQFNGISKTNFQDEEIILQPNSQSIFHITDLISSHELYKDNALPFSFFEIKISKKVTQDIFPEEMWNEMDFVNPLFTEQNSHIESVKPITPQMQLIISDIRQNPFKGYMKKSYIEAKVIELFLLQAESHRNIQKENLRKDETNRIMSAKDYLDQNYNKKIKIIDLAKIIGTNQQTLKKGFKELFGTTIWGYYNDLRMEIAKDLLINQEKSIAEVADNIGYKNPQHFTVAFKKKYGILPRTLKYK